MLSQRKRKNTQTKVSGSVTGNGKQYSHITCEMHFTTVPTCREFCRKVYEEQCKIYICDFSEPTMCPDKEQTLYTVPLFWSGAGACSRPKNTTRDKRSDMINAAFALAGHNDPTKSG